MKDYFERKMGGEGAFLNLVEEAGMNVSDLQMEIGQYMFGAGGELKEAPAGWD